VLIVMKHNYWRNLILVIVLVTENNLIIVFVRL
jgi:hypothetical protein